MKTEEIIDQQNKQISKLIADVANLNAELSRAKDVIHRQQDVIELYERRDLLANSLKALETVKP